MFIDKFPKITYDINRRKPHEYQLVPNLLFRVNVIREILGNISAYYTYTIKDSDRPDTLAEKVYGDPMAFWIIFYANDIYDPEYDWPLNSDAFEKYIKTKYGTIAAAKTGIHHYEKVISREDSLTGIVTETKLQINESVLTEDDTFDVYDSLAEDFAYATYAVGDGRTVTELISRNSVSYYDYEESLNEAKRIVKIIKPEYYVQIMQEFDELTKVRR